MKRRRMQKRVICWLTTLTLVMNMFFGVSWSALPQASAASWMDVYLNQMVEWGVMRGDISGNLDGDRNISRAEFVTMLNRAYGYTEMGETPFTDIKSTDWYYEDICIAYNAGYLKGTTDGTTASPTGLLTREQAAVLIGRNMMLQEGTGEALGFTDSREFNEWSRHLIQAVAEEGVITGYPNGAYGPQDNVTRGQVAAMLTRAIGTLVNEPGEQSLGGVYGNVTVNTPGVTLKNTVIVGDLYITGGLGLGDVTLENVSVTGRIVVSGAGESEKGEHSVTLRNVSADELVVDSMASQFVTLKTEGLTNIDSTTVRTSAYLEDLTDDGYGLLEIDLDGENGLSFYLAGNIKDVVNYTPESYVYLAQGVAQTINIDETALNSTLQLDGDTVADSVNLDTAATVTGSGDIGHLTVNAAGSTATMLPDTVTVRPGLDAYVGGERMDTAAAVESSTDPRILAGYPKPTAVAPTTASVVFQTNKRGTIYWALTALADGTVKEADLINPPTYGGNIMASGSITATDSATDYTASLTGLTKDGSYYVSAILVDNRGMRSPVKITAFTTPDDTVPAFTTGYPSTVIADGADDEQIVQVMAMTNKSCLMYYALFASGSTAPTAADFKANSLAGNLGSGVVEMTKNTPFLVPQVNRSYLEEETNYDLYLWLCDADGAKSSAVTKLTPATLDRTSPKVTALSVNNIAATSVSFNVTLDEPGTFYWAVVKSGATFYTSPAVTEDSEAGKIQITSGVNSLHGRSNPVRVNSAGTQVSFTVSGLEEQTAYDLYYVAVDEAENYSSYTTAIDHPYEFHTLDTRPPTVEQKFTHDGTEEGSDNLTPYPDSSIQLVFSEKIQGMLDLNEDGYPDYDKFLELYQRAKDPNDTEYTEEDLAKMLTRYIKLYQTGSTTPVTERTSENEDEEAIINGGWVIDYRKVKIEMDTSGEGKLIVNFPYNTDSSKSALNLAGGVTYQFVVEGIGDVSTAANQMARTPLKNFTVISAQIMLVDTYVAPSATYTCGSDTAPLKFTFNEFDMTFSAEPVSHEAMDDGVLWDMIFWSDTMVSFELYESADEGQSWTKIGSEAPINAADGEVLGVSVGTILRNYQYDPINQMADRLLYGIKVTSINDERNEDNWNVPITLRVTTITGEQSHLRDAGINLMSKSSSYESVVEKNRYVSDITISNNDPPSLFEVTHPFTDDTPPNFVDQYPTFVPGDTSVKINVMLDRPNSYFYYAIARKGDLRTVLADGTSVSGEMDVKNLIPASGAGFYDEATETWDGKLVTASIPQSGYIWTQTPNLNGSIKYDNGTFTGGLETFTVNGLQANTDYLAYFVLMGESTTSASPQAYVFHFSTGDVETPTIYLSDSSPSVRYETSTDSVMSWMLVSSTVMSNWEQFQADFYDGIGFNANNLELGDYNGDKEVNDKDVQYHFEQNYKTYFTNLADDKDHSDVRVLDALMTNMGSNDYMSVFDYYAGATLYKLISEYVTQTTSANDRAGYGTLDTTAGSSPDNSIPLDSYMEYVSNYYFIAVARNTMGSTYAFKAISNIHNVDNTPPELAGSPTVIAIAYADADEKTLCNKDKTDIDHWNVTIALTFTKKPYLLTEGSEKAEELSTTITDKITFLGVQNGYSASLEGESIIIKFKTIWSTPASVTIFKSGYVSNASGYANRNKLELDLSFPFYFNGEKPTCTNTWNK